MDYVAQTLALSIAVLLWIVIGLAVSIWLDNRFFQRDVRTFGVSLALANKKPLRYIIFTTWAAMVVGPLMIVVAYHFDPLRKKVTHS